MKPLFRPITMPLGAVGKHRSNRIPSVGKVVAAEVVMMFI
jgi:hypothetical protein